LSVVVLLASTTNKQKLKTKLIKQQHGSNYVVARGGVLCCWRL